MRNPQAMAFGSVTGKRLCFPLADLLRPFFQASVVADSVGGFLGKRIIDLLPHGACLRKAANSLPPR